jgi:hypothetical protein
MAVDDGVSRRRDIDAFISYARADQAWVRVLAENLHQAGLEVYYDEWEIGPGDVLVHRLDEGLGGSRNGVLVVSPSALSRLWVNAEYAALMTRAVEGKQRLIPVLLRDAELPPLLASLVWVDFRGVDGPEYERRVRELVKALRGERPGPPPRTGGLRRPPTAIQPSGDPSPCAPPARMSGQDEARRPRGARRWLARTWLVALTTAGLASATGIAINVATDLKHSAIAWVAVAALTVLGATVAAWASSRTG